MRKILIVILVMGCASQNVSAQLVRGGFQVGFNTTYRLGGTAGLLAELALSKKITLQPGLFIVQKGTNNGMSVSFSPDDFLSVSKGAKSRINYVEIPVNLVFYLRSRENGFFAGAGFNYSKGISGWETKSGSDVQQQIVFGNEYGNYRRNGYGVSYLFGYIFKTNFIVSFGGAIGLTPVADNHGTPRRNSTASFRAGFLIGRKKDSSSGTPPSTL